MKQWEYTFKYITPRSALHTPAALGAMNEWGLSGWELTAVVTSETGHTLIFKRNSGYVYGPQPPETVSGPAQTTSPAPDTSGRG